MSRLTLAFVTPLVSLATFWTRDWQAAQVMPVMSKVSLAGVSLGMLGSLPSCGLEPGDVAA